MYCVIETQFQCTGDAAQCATKFNAVLADLRELMAGHRDVSCNRFGDGDWRISADQLQEHPESDADIEKITGGNG